MDIPPYPTGIDPPPDLAPVSDRALRRKRRAWWAGMIALCLAIPCWLVWYDIRTRRTRWAIEWETIPGHDLAGWIMAITLAVGTVLSVRAIAGGGFLIKCAGAFAMVTFAAVMAWYYLLGIVKWRTVVEYWREALGG